MSSFSVSGPIGSIDLCNRLYVKWFEETLALLMLSACSRNDRLSAIDMLQIRKVMEHVYEKIVYPASLTGQSGEEPPAPADIAAAIDKIEIL